MFVLNVLPSRVIDEIDRCVKCTSLEDFFIRWCKTDLCEDFGRGLETVREDRTVFSPDFVGNLCWSRMGENDTACFRTNCIGHGTSLVVDNGGKVFDSRLVQSIDTRDECEVNTVEPPFLLNWLASPTGWLIL